MRFSVIVPLYNKAPWVGRAIHSVLAQTVTDLEVLVVDDGSTDDGLQVVASIRDSRVRLIRQSNQGAAAARNTGIRAASGDWVAFLDADDEWLPHHLAALGGVVELFPDVSWAVASYATQASGGAWNVRGAARALGADPKQLVDDGLRLVASHEAWTGAVMVRRRVFDDLGVFDTGMQTGEDVDLWLRVAVRFPRVARSKVVSSLYYDTPQSLMKYAGLQSRTNEVLIQRFLELLPLLPRDRQRYLWDMIWYRVNDLIINGLLSGDRASAAAALCRYGAMLPVHRRLRYRAYLVLPRMLLMALLRMRLMVHALTQPRPKSRLDFVSEAKASK
jgi:glycosyltransferase involved in cell wall biosynthesis